MIYVKINNQQIIATVSGKTKDTDWDSRSSKTICCAMSYENAIDIFADNVSWSIIYQEDSYVDESGEMITPDPIEYDNSEYSIAGPITDNRDGTISVKMGKPTELEEMTKERDQALNDLEDVMLIAYGGI